MLILVVLTGLLIIQRVYGDADYISPTISPSVIPSCTPTPVMSITPVESSPTLSEVSPSATPETQIGGPASANNTNNAGSSATEIQPTPYPTYPANTGYGS